MRRISPVILGVFTFRSWIDNDPLLAALDVVRELHASGAKKLPPHPSMSFLRPAWRKLVKMGARSWTVARHDTTERAPFHRRPRMTVVGAIYA